MCESFYDSKLTTQCFVRIYRFESTNQVFIYILYTKIEIELTIDDKRKTRNKFNVIAFLKNDFDARKLNENNTKNIDDTINNIDKIIEIFDDN